MDRRLANLLPMFPRSFLICNTISPYIDRTLCRCASQWTRSWTGTTCPLRTRRPSSRTSSSKSSPTVPSPSMRNGTVGVAPLSSGRNARRCAGGRRSWREMQAPGEERGYYHHVVRSRQISPCISILSGVNRSIIVPIFLATVTAYPSC